MRKLGNYCIHCEKDFKYSKGKKYCSKECKAEAKIKTFEQEIEKKLRLNSYKEFLFQKYVVEENSLSEIADIVYGQKSKKPKIATQLRHYGIQVRSKAEGKALSWTEERIEHHRKINSGKNNPMYNIYITGENHWHWKPEKDREQRERDRKTRDYNLWRAEVYKRDSFTCQCCSDSTGGNLVAHHKNGWNWAIDERYEIDNGITLCNSCHSEFHNIYGFGDNTEEQFEEFISNLVI